MALPSERIALIGRFPRAPEKNRGSTSHHKVRQERWEMIVEAANEGAQSLPSRVSNAQRIHEKSVSNGDILAVLDSSSEDDASTAEFKPSSNESSRQSKLVLPPPIAPVEKDRKGHTPLMLGVGKVNFTYSTRDKYQPSEIIKRPIIDRLSMAMLEDIPQDAPNYVQLREDCAAAGLPSIDNDPSFIRSNILQRASKFSAANHTYGRVIGTLASQSPPKMPHASRDIELKASVPGAHKTNQFNSTHVVPLRVLPRICASAPVTANGNSNQPVMLVPLRTKSGVQMRDISYDRVAAASAAAAAAAERAEALMQASEKKKFQHSASPERLAEILAHRRKRMAEQLKSNPVCESVAMDDDAEDEDAAETAAVEEEVPTVNIDMVLSESDVAVHKELVAAGGAEGSAEDALNATLASAMMRLDFFHAARAAYDEQCKSAISRGVQDKKRYTGSGFEDVTCKHQSAVIDLATNLAERRLPPRPAIFHADKCADGSVLKWQYFGYGADFANAHSEAMGAMGFSGFNFTECRLGTTGLREIMPAITADLQQLTQLDLTSNNLRDAGATILAHSLSGYDPIGGPGCRAVQSLRELILSHNGIGNDGAKVLSENLFFVPSLAVLMLDNNLIGGDGARHLAKLVRESESLTSLNLAWNKIRGPGAAEFGDAFAINSSILNLNIAWNSFGKLGLAPLTSCLVANSTLKHLNLTHNGLSDVPVILLCYAMRRNRCIETLTLDGNPIGRKGFNAVQRIIRLDESGALTIGTEGCAIDAPSDIPNFSIKRPDGFWRLDFSLPEHRAIASELWEVAVKQRGENWIGETLDGLDMNISEDPRYPWIIPTKGIMEVDFVSCPDPPMADDVVKGPIIQRMLALMASSSEKEKQGIVSSAAFEEIFVSSQVAELLSSIEDMGERLSACIALFSRVVDLEDKMLFVQHLGPSEQNLLPSYVGALYYFNPSFPTGHYKLRMEDDNDLALMTRLRQIAFDEKKNRRFNSLPDVSQWGNEDCCFRNVHRDGNFQEPSNITKGGQLPAKGTFEFDFTTTKMPSSDSKPLAMSLLQRVMSNLIVALRPSVNMHIKEILQMLRRYKYSSLQVMMLAKLVKIKRYRIEVAVCLFNCVTDIENFAMKLWEHFTDVDERQEVCSRLGWMLVFNPLELDGFYRFELHRRDEHEIVKMLVDLSVREPGENWSEEAYNNKPFELPLSWVEPEMMDGATGKVPDKGPLSLNYKTWPGCKRTRVRRRMCDLLLIGEVLAKRSVDDPLGTGILSLDLLPGSSTGEVWVQLEGVRSGSVLVEVSVEPDPTRGALAKEGLVTVRIIRAKNLIAADACGTSDPYCVLSLGSDSLMNFAKTDVVMQTLEPEFNETFELQEVDMPLQLPLKIEVFDWDDPNEEDDQADVQELQVQGGSALTKSELDSTLVMSSMGGSIRAPTAADAEHETGPQANVAVETAKPSIQTDSSSPSLLASDNQNREHKQLQILAAFGNTSAKQITDLKKLEDASVDDELKVLNLIENFGIGEQKKDVSTDDSDGSDGESEQRKIKKLAKLGQEIKL